MYQHPSQLDVVGSDEIAVVVVVVEVVTAVTGTAFVVIVVAFVAFAVVVSRQTDLLAGLGKTKLFGW
jgi:hypothetical protein